MIPYVAALDAFMNIFGLLPLPMRMFVVTSIALYLGVNFIFWLIEKVLG